MTTAHLPGVAGAEPAADRRAARRLVLLLGSLAALGPAGVDGPVPALPLLTDDFGVSASAAQLTVALFVAGLAIGQVFAGAIADILGRRRPLLASVAAFVASSAACALAPTVVLLSAARLVQGIAAAAGVAITRAVIRDLYSGPDGSRLLSQLVLVYGLSPVVTPVLAGQLLRFFDWRSIFVMLMAFALAVLAVAFRRLPETLPPQRRTSGTLAATLASFGWLARDRGLLGFAVALSLCSAAVLTFVTSTPYVLQDIHGVSPQLYGAIFAAAGILLMGGAQLNATLVRRVDPGTLLYAGLGLLICAGLLALAGALWLGGPLAPSLALGGSFLGWSLAMPNALALGMAGHAERAGAASALLGVAQYGLGATIVPLVGLGGRATAVPMAAVIVAFAVAALIAVLTLTGPRPRTARVRG